jgi:hypothetical protein
VKDVFCWWAKILGPVPSRVVFFTIHVRLSHLLLRLFSCTLRLFGYVGCGRLHCEICASGCAVCLICHAWENMLFCYDRHLIHLQICSLLPFVLTPFWVLFFPILQRDPNGERPNAKVSTARSSTTFSAKFFIILHRCIYERNILPLLCIQDLTSFIDAGRLYVDRKFLVN